MKAKSLQREVNLRSSHCLKLLPNTCTHRSHFPQPSWFVHFSGLQCCLVGCQIAGLWTWALIQRVWMLLRCSFNDCSQVLLQMNMPSVVFEEVCRVSSFDLQQHRCFLVSRLVLICEIRRGMWWFLLVCVEVWTSWTSPDRCFVNSCSMLRTSKHTCFFITSHGKTQQGVVGL